MAVHETFPLFEMAEPSSVARKALEKLADQINCAICLDTYTHPKVLPCLHIYCEQCLGRLALQGGGQTVQCPKCRRTSPLPATGVSGFQSAFFVSDLIEGYHAMKKALESPKVTCDKCPDSEAVGFCKDCKMLVCDFCTQVHKKWPELTGHTIVSIEEFKAKASEHIIPKKKVKYCDKHPDEQLKIFCETCGLVICRDCIIDEHQGHKYHLLSKVASKHKEAIRSSTQPVQEQLEAVTEALAEVDTRLQEVGEQGMRVKDSIQQIVDELHTALEARKRELFDQVEQIVQQKKKALDNQKAELELMHVQASSCLNFVEESLQSGTDAEILGMRNTILERAEEIKATFDRSKLKPQEEAHLLFVPSDDAVQHCQSIGRVTTTKMVCPSKSFANGEGAKNASVGEMSTFTVHAIAEDGSEYTAPLKDITHELVSEPDGAVVVKASLVKQKNNSYQFQYQPVCRGQSALHIKINSKNIRGSPYPVFVHMPPTAFGNPVQIITGVQEPLGVAVTEDRLVAVSDWRNHCISLFGPDGKKIRSFGEVGSDQGQFSCPSGVVEDREGNLLVTDDHCIQKFTKEGELLTSVGSQGIGQLQFDCTYGIAINKSSGKIYIADEQNHRIQVLNEDLSYSHEFGSRGINAGRSNTHHGVAIASDGTVYVADTDNHRIQVFTPEGEHLRQFGEKGSGDGQLNGPDGVCVARNGNTFVSDTNNHRICIFDSRGQFISSFGRKGNNPGEFNEPCLIAVDRNGFLYVADYENNRIQVF